MRSDAGAAALEEAEQHAFFSGCGRFMQTSVRRGPMSGKRTALVARTSLTFYLGQPMW
jgi:hypothetical protein